MAFLSVVQEVTHFDVHRVLSDDERYRTDPGAVSTDALVGGQRPHTDDQCRDAWNKTTAPSSGTYLNPHFYSMC